jgi:uncharacterized membrane protein YhaH (DUF805 family)
MIMNVPSEGFILWYIHTTPVRHIIPKPIPETDVYIIILHFTFLVPLFVYVSAAGHYFRRWTDSIWTGQVFMALRVIWQYMDRSVTQNILYGPQLVYGPVRLQKNIIWKQKQKYTNLIKNK